jgi:hypothetical protein
MKQNDVEKKEKEKVINKNKIRLNTSGESIWGKVAQDTRTGKRCREQKDEIDRK